MRITAEGQFRSCLFALGGDRSAHPAPLGSFDDELEQLIRDGMWAKWSGHRINHSDFVQPARSMSMIGG